MKAERGIRAIIVDIQYVTLAVVDHCVDGWTLIAPNSHERPIDGAFMAVLPFSKKLDITG